MSAAPPLAKRFQLRTPPNGKRVSEIKPTLSYVELVKQWDKKIEKIIRSYGLVEDVDDLKQEIYLRILENDGLANYDPARGAFSTYMYAVIVMKVRNARTKRRRELGLMPFTMEAKDFMDGEDDSNGRRQRDRIEVSSLVARGELNPQRRTEIKIQIEKVLDVLRFQPVRSLFYRDGECITRDLRTLMIKILEGMSREDIVKYFDYSTGSVGILFKELRDVPEVKELWDLVVSG